MKLQQLLRSRLKTRAKVKLFHSTIVPSLTYSLDTLTLELRHFKTIDGWYHKYLRNCIGIKASYFSHISNGRVWIFVGRPKLPSQLLMEQQIQQLCKILATPPDNPLHHVVFFLPDIRIKSSSPSLLEEDTPNATGWNKYWSGFYQYSKPTSTTPPLTIDGICWALNNTYRYTPNIAYNWRLRRRARPICSKDTPLSDAHGNRKKKPGHHPRTFKVQYRESPH